MRLVNPWRTLIYRSVHIGSTLELWLYLQKHKLDYFHPHTDQVARQVVRNKASNSVEGKFLAYLILVNINSSRCQVFKVHGGEFQNIVTRPMKLRCFSRKNGIWMQWRVSSEWDILLGRSPADAFSRLGACTVKKQSDRTILPVVSRIVPVRERIRDTWK